ncbi:hypothetical protein FDP41_004878 [Naegleria fowleri]|uniref:Uncharacterized protein n=1 Tax=Naegleria fowleri TaxID=5763 RepID=A0A6A5BEC7_NAEFO|nr:uncharacterized protein FDP41_004878 [Naegleria fowleri]KAF0976203.1 hypothetical protein FDP41_004878 [Naegleria fowleri]
MVIALLSSFFFSMKLNAVNKLAPSKTGEEQILATNSSCTLNKAATTLTTSSTKDGFEEGVINGSKEGVNDVVGTGNPNTSSHVSTLREQVFMVETQSSMALVPTTSGQTLTKVRECDVDQVDSVLMETQSQASDDESAHSGASIEAHLLASRYRAKQEEWNSDDHLVDRERTTMNDLHEDPSPQPSTHFQTHHEENDDGNDDAPEISPEDLFYIQKYLLVLWPLIPMFMYQDWTVFTRYDTIRWLMFIWFMVMNRLVAAVLELWSAKEIGSSNYSIMFPIRIVIGLILSSVVLGEWIDNLVSILGCVVVVAAITAFSIKKHSK